MRILLTRTRMCGFKTPHCSYHVYVRLSDLGPIHKLHNRGGTILSYLGMQETFVSLTEATLPVDHFSMPLGFPRYEAFKAREASAKCVEQMLLNRAFPETVGTSIPKALWIETPDVQDAEVWVDFEPANWLQLA